MNLWLFGTYMLAVAALMATPGPNIFLMVTHSITYGRVAIVPNALGGMTAAFILICLALFGVAQWLPKSFLPYLALVGAAYLLWLAWRNWHSAVRIHAPGVGEAAPRPHFFRDALLAGLSNPKDLLFFILFLPQFVDPKLPLWQNALWLLGGWMVCDFSIMSSYGLLAERFKRLLSGRKQYLVARVLSIIMATLGLILLARTLVDLLA